MQAKRCLLVVGVVGLLVGVSWMGVSLLSNSRVLASTDPQQKWEYMVICPGKVGFSSPFASPMDKSAGLSIGTSILPPTEALDTETILDNAGKVGWELVTVVGVIGGDQEFVFKRPLP